MVYAGFWTHRESNDIVFVVQQDPDDFIRDFSNFLKKTAGIKRLPIFNKTFGSDFYQIGMDWKKLVSIEVQTEKFTSNRDTVTLHAKFYFEEDSADFISENYRHSNAREDFKKKVQWWNAKELGSRSEVFRNDAGEGSATTLVVDDLIEFMNNAPPVSLPQQKNIYIYRKDYAAKLESAKTA